MSVVASPPVLGGLRVQGLTVRLAASGRLLLDGVDLQVAPGEVVALVGPSGAGKSTLLRAMLGRLPRVTESRWVAGSLATTDGAVDLSAADTDAWRRLRRSQVRVVAQDPVAALTPLRRVGSLVAESARLAGRPDDRATVLAGLAAAGFGDPESAARLRSDQLSGGMAQRVGVALALVAQPALVLADEPTTALDPVARRAVLDALRAAADAGAAVVLVTHDLAATRSTADRVLGLRGGRVVEVEEALSGERTTAVAARGSGPAPGAPAALVMTDVVHGYGDRVVLDRIGLRVAAGEVVGLRGASGAGKTTLLESIVTGTPPRSGSVQVAGADVRELGPRRVRRQVQLVPQQPRESLNPWRTALQAVCEPLEVHRIGSRSGRRERATAMLEALGLGDRLQARPAELSTGECQRVCLARALVTGPRLLLADEPVTSLDAELADEAMALLVGAARERGAGLLLVSHDHGRLERYCDRVLEMALLGAPGSA